MSVLVTAPVLFNLPRPKDWEAWWAGYGFEVGFVPQPSVEGMACQLTVLRNRLLVHVGTQPVPDTLKPKVAQLLRLLNKTAESNPTNFGRLLRTQQGRELQQYLVLRTELQTLVRADGRGHSWQEAVDNAWSTVCESVHLNRVASMAVRALWELTC